MKDRVLDRRTIIAKGVGGALAAMWLAAAVPLAAQDNGAATSAPAANPNDIGPGGLSNFSLNGTVTQPAGRPPAATVPPPASSAPAATPPATARDTAPATVAPATSGNRQPAAPDNDLFSRPPTLPDSSAAPVIGSTPPVIDEPLATASPVGLGGFPIWPWLIGLLAIAGGALLWFFRRRNHNGRYAAAGHASIDIVLPSPPTPTPAPRADPAVGFAPRPDPTPAPPASGVRKPLPTTLMPPPSAPPRVEPRPDPIIPGGIVSTGLRPWIDVELSPDRALLDEQGAAIAFEVTLYNSGSAAARDVIIEAKLLNAGVSQDVELSAFFTADTAVSDPIPQIAPYARIPLRSAVRLPLEAISEYEYEGRKLFMPLVAISVRYRWSNGDGQSAAGFLVGQGNDGQDKLAPLRIDRGARSWNGLGARRYEKGVRR